MSLIINSTEIKKILYVKDDVTTDLDILKYGDTVVFQKEQDTSWIGVASFSEASTVNKTKWISTSNDSVESGITNNYFQPSGAPTSYSVNLAYFKVNSKYKYMDVSASGDFGSSKIGIWGYDKISGNIGTQPYKITAYSISENTTNLNLNDYISANPTYPYLGVYSTSSTYTITIKLHN